MTTNAAPMIELKSISRVFGTKAGIVGRSLQAAGLAKPAQSVQALNSVDLTLAKGEVVGLVGESGCGKSTLGRIAAGIIAPTQGSVRWNGRDIAAFAGRQADEWRAARLRVQMVFQNPFASLNPRLRVGQIVGEAPRVHGLMGEASEADYVDAQLLRAGLDPRMKARFPHQLSGGQRQRVGIARALAVGPEVLICDEAVAALDVSIQAQIINLFMHLRESLSLTYLFISHDLGVVRHLSDRVAIMYLGRIVETAPVELLFMRPNHPYTQLLLEEMPRIDGVPRPFSIVHADQPSPLNPPTGCHFHPRCPHVMARCRDEIPALREVSPGHDSACHLNDMK